MAAQSTTTDRIDRAFVVTAAAITLLFLVPKLFQHAAAHTGDMDTGNYSNLAWAIGHGEGFTGSVTGRHHLGEHFSPIMLLIAPVYLVWPSAYVLMILQALATAATIVLVLRFPDREMRAASPSPSPGTPGEGRGEGDSHRARTRFLASALLLVLFLLYPPLLATWRTQFQPIELGMPLVVLAIILMHDRRDIALAIVTTLLLMTRESAPLAVAGLAIYAGLALRRWRLALALLVVAGAWAGITMGWIMPWYRTGNRWPHARWIDPAAMWDKKLVYLATMLLSFGPLPFLNSRARAATAAALPGMMLNLLVARDTQLTFVGHYDAQTAPFLMIAAAHGVVTLMGWLESSAKRWWAAIASAVALCVTFFAITNAKTPFQLLGDWRPTRTRLALAAEARSLARDYRNAPALSAWANLGPQVCHRRNYVGMRCGTTRSTFREWSDTRLAPGTVLLVPTARYSDKEAAAVRKLIEGSGGAQRVREGELVEAWEWRGSDGAPRR